MYSPQVFEKLHFVIFGIMILFLFIVVLTILYAIRVVR